MKLIKFKYSLMDIDLKTFCTIFFMSLHSGFTLYVCKIFQFDISWHSESLRV